MLVNRVVDRDVADKLKSYKLLSRIAKNKNIDLDLIKVSTQEARRILWTNAKFLIMWFNTWEANLIALGFGKKSDVDGHLEELEKSQQRSALRGLRGKVRFELDLEETRR